MHATEVILCDTFQYSRQSYQNRARLRTPDGWQWISVPLRSGQHGRPIVDVSIRNSVDWQKQHARSLQHNYATAPFFAHFGPEVVELLSERWDELGALTVATTEWMLRAFRLSPTVTRTSSLHSRPSRLDHLHEGLGNAQVLVTGPGSHRDLAVFPDAKVVELEEARRHQNFDGFVPGMSALDLLFNYGREGLSLIASGTRITSRPTGLGASREG